MSRMTTTREVIVGPTRRVLAVAGIALFAASWSAWSSSEPLLPSGSNIGVPRVINGTKTAETIAKGLVLSAGDVPAGWTSDDSAGPCIASGPGSAPGTPYCGNPPLPGEQATDERFARCVGVPISHVSMWTGVDEPGEPFTYSSSTYTAPGGSRTNPTDQAPTALSNLTIEGSAAFQRSDLEAFTKRSFPACFKIEENGVVFKFIRAYASSAHLKLSFEPLQRVTSPSVPGVNVVEYVQTLTFTSHAFSGASTYWMVLMGATNIEEYLELGGSSAYPLRAPIAEGIIGRLEARLAKFART